MKYNDLKNKTVAELTSDTETLKVELFKLKLKNKTAQLENKAKIREARRDIARLQTKISELSGRAS